MRLADIAPRLAKARDQLLEDRRRERAERRRLAQLTLSAERNLAHRELQLVRAFHTGKPKYIAERQRKLDAAKREVARYREAA